MKRIFLTIAALSTLTLTSCIIRTPDDIAVEAKTLYHASMGSLEEIKEIEKLKIDGIQIVSTDDDKNIITDKVAAEKFRDYLKYYIEYETFNRNFIVFNENYECMYVVSYDGKYVASCPSGVITDIKDGKVETEYMYKDELHEECKYTYDELYNICVSKLNEYAECEKEE